MLSRQLINYICAQNGVNGFLSSIQELITINGKDFNIDSAEMLSSAIEVQEESSDNVLLKKWLFSLENSTALLPRFLYGRFMTRQGEYIKAVEALISISEALQNTEPYLLLNIARLMVRIKSFAKAAETLKLALSLTPPYSFFVKCEKLLQKIIASGDWHPRRRIRVALLGSSTTAFLAPILQACCFKNGIHAEVYEGGFGNFRQDILDANSPFYAFKPQATILLLNYRDLALQPISDAVTVQQVADDIQTLWSIIQKRNPCHLIQIGFDLPQYGSWGSLEDVLPGGRARIINTINLRLSGNLPPGISFFDVNRVAFRLGDTFSSDIGWYSSKQYPSLDALPILADHLVAYLRAAFGYSAKVLVLDLDNTLWGGVIGEDGLAGIVIGPPSPEGEGYLELQKYAKELKERGVLLAICSKNNLEDAELPFKEHDSMLLKLDDFVLFTANWQDKATNIREMAQNLSLGMDSFVFLDDNPLERAWVRSSLPEVIVPECGNKPWTMLAALRTGMYFEVIAITAEDAERHKSYKDNLVRQDLEKQSDNIEDFLLGLEMVAESGQVGPTTLTRVTQLINKTNQFNLTTRRYTEEQVRTMSEAPDWWTRWFRLKDKFGDHGLIGVILAKKSGGIWDIDTWLMSCRVLGRNMEKFMLADLVGSALKDSASAISGVYIPTAKNILVDKLYANLGFQPESRANHFVLQLKERNTPPCEFIRSATSS